MNEKDNENSQESEKDKWSFSDFVTEFYSLTGFLFFFIFFFFIGYSNKQLELKHQEVKAETYIAINQCTDSYYEIYYEELEGIIYRNRHPEILDPFNLSEVNLARLEALIDSQRSDGDVKRKQIIYETFRDYCSLEYTEMDFNELQKFYIEQQNTLRFRIMKGSADFLGLIVDLGRDLRDLFR